MKSLYTIRKSVLFFVVVSSVLLPVQSTDAQIAESYDGFGSFVATGDFNGDGFMDLAVTARNEELEKVDVRGAGAIHIIYGSDLWLSPAGDEFWHRDVPGIEGTPHTSANFGEEVTACDFNGDGYDDVAIAVVDDPVYGILGSGSVNVLYGSKDGITYVGDQLWLQGMLSIPDFPEEHDRFGSALAAGDFNGDDYCDLAIGVAEEEIHGVELSGLVHVLYGTSAGLSDVDNQLLTLENTLDASMISESEDGSLFGHELAAGDFNSDGLDDLAIAAPYYDIPNSVQDAGAIIVLHGSTRRGLDDAYRLVQSGSSQLGSPKESEAMGYGSYILDLYDAPQTLATGDFDGNGADDLAVGSPLDYEGESSPPFVGSVSVFFGSVGNGLLESQMQVWKLSHFGYEQTYSGFGTALAAGNFNGDQYDDLAIGIPKFDAESVHVSTGSVGVLYGKQYAGLTLNQSQFWNQSVPGVLGKIDDYEEWGSSLAAGDFNKDGKDDLAVGSALGVLYKPGEEYGTIAGETNVLYGTSYGLGTDQNQLWHQDLDGIDGDGMVLPGIENGISDAETDNLFLREDEPLEGYTFELQANYPNPFKDNTFISYTLADEVASTAQLEVFDVTGKRVRTLFYGSGKAGPHIIQWDGRDDGGHKLAAGVYLIRMQQGLQIATQMSMLLH